MTKNKNNYKDSGVNIEEGQKFIDDIKDLTSNISPKYSLGHIGGFSGYVEIPNDINCAVINVFDTVKSLVTYVLLFTDILL